MANEIERKVGRPLLSPEERELRRKEKIKRDNARKKAQGYKAQQRYRDARRGSVYEPKLSIPADKKEILFQLMSDTGLTTTQLFVGAVEEKYGVILHKVIDSAEE